MPQTRAGQMAKMARRAKGVVAKIRMLAACMRKKGKSIRKIAAELCVPSSTVYDWLLRMHRRGPKGRFDKRRRGRKRILDNDCLRNLKEWLAVGPDKHGLGSGDWQWDTILELIRAKTGTVCSTRTIRRVLRKIHKSYRKLNPVPHNSASKEEPWLTVYNKNSWCLVILYVMNKKQNVPRTTKGLPDFIFATTVLNRDLQSEPDEPAGGTEPAGESGMPSSPMNDAGPGPPAKTSRSDYFPCSFRI